VLFNTEADRTLSHSLIELLHYFTLVFYYSE